jgi:hypothetical protein
MFALIAVNPVFADQPTLTQKYLIAQTEAAPAETVTAEEKAATVEATEDSTKEVLGEKVEVGEPELDRAPDMMVDIFQPLMKLVTEWKTLGTMGIMMVLINLLIAILKSSWASGWFGKQSRKIRTAVIILAGQVQGILLLMTSGMTWGEAIVSGLFASGAAVTTWQLVMKPFFTKEEPAT